MDRVSELDGQVRAAEELAFEFEAKAAELEVDLFRRMDEEHEALMKEARAAEYAAPVQHSPLKVMSPPGQEQSTPLSPPATAAGGSVTIAACPKQAERGGDVNTLTASHHDFSSPSLPLLSHPSAPPRIPKEGYAVLLIVVSWISFFSHVLRPLFNSFHFLFAFYTRRSRSCRQWCGAWCFWRA